MATPNFTPEQLLDLAYQQAHPEDDTRYQMIASAVVCTVAAIFAVALRMYARTLTKGGFGKDDYVMILGLAVYIVFEVISTMLTIYGIGRHLIYISDQWRLGVFTLVGECLDSILIPIVETSVLLFYHRLFPQQRFRLYLWIVGGILWASKLAFVPVSIWQCTPVAKAWYTELPGQCIEYWKAVLVTSVFNILIDVVILLMPVPMLWNLQLKLKQRLQIIFAFAFGAFTCIVGIVRTVYTPALADFDVTWAIVPVIVCSSIEGCLFIVSGCIPTYVALLTYRNRNTTSRTLQSRSVFAKQNQDYGMLSLAPRHEVWTSLESVSGQGEEGRVVITTNISTTYEPKE